MSVSATGPALALDYEAKPVKWVLLAPIRLAGAVSGAVVSGAAYGPLNHGDHLASKGTQKMAGKFGDDKGAGQLAAGSVIGVPTGTVVGGTYGVGHGLVHGFKTGWDKPFSRWSYNDLDGPEGKEKGK